LMLFISPDGKCQPGSSVQSFGNGIVAKRFYSSTVDNNNVVWFLTESGIVNFNGSTWALQNKNSKIDVKDIKDLDFATSENKNELWMAGSNGATVVNPPLSEESKATNYNPENSKILSTDVKAIAAGKTGLRWFGTDKGVSALENSKWLANDYSDRYPEDVFKYYPLSSMATTRSGDTLYVGTVGGGVFRYYKNDVDAVSGASEYAIWGPIIIPSDTVQCVYIAPDGLQWIGTKRGAAKHSGYNALEGWTIYDKKGGLADDMVQAINADTKGKLYFGTKNGLTVLDGTKLTTYRVENGLGSNNILTIAIDRNNVVWLGTDNGVTCLKNGEFIKYR
jgi:ligand-binding sensor domain-containing protein